MSERMQTDTHPASTGGKRGRSALARGARALLVGALAAGLALAGATPAIAADGIGGGGVGGGGGGSGPSQYYWLYTGDSLTAAGQPQQGWGQQSIDAFANAMEQHGNWASAMNGRTGLNQACWAAINNAIARSNGQATQARVIQVGTSVDSQNGNWYMGWGGTKTAMTNWYNDLTNQWYWQPMLPGYDANLLNAVQGTFVGSIGETPRIVCVALNNTEMANYDLSISTDKVGEFSIAGSTAAVRDRINASRGSSGISESATATVTLNWGGVEGNGTSRSKNVAIANSGSTNSPAFTPSDFGWTSWPAGKFWFDVSVPKQGKMRAAVSHAGANDSRENWTAATTPPRKVLTSGPNADELADDEVLASGMFYNAEITARTNGFTSSMTITDTIDTDKVWIGSQLGDNADAPYLRDPNGNRVSASSSEVTITRSGGKVTVAGTVRNIPAAHQAQEYTLVVPTYVQPTKADYSISDSSKVCYTAAQTNCLDGNSKTTRKVTPTPDKVWVIDEDGALSTADPGQTNQEGVDNKVFAPGAQIGAVVNGKIPAKLAENLSQYSITDDWSAAEKYIDFNDASKVRVFLDGVNVTSQFTITIADGKTTATAKAAFLNGTKGLAQAKTVKLYIGGEFRSDYNTGGNHERLTNSGSETLNNETVATNSPAIYTVTPSPDKVWVIDEEGALSSEDPSGSNDAGVDGKAFAPGASISAVVNGSLPTGLAQKLNSYTITDDWSAAAKYIDFSDASKAKVFLDGKNVTSMFDVVVSGNKTIATAKQSFLDLTVERTTIGEVKLFITGQFRNTYDTDGKIDRLTNSGSEAWNGKAVTTNTPAIYTVTPTPDKVWVIDEDGALTSSDGDWTNNAGADGKVFLPNDAVAAVVNGSIPANLGSALNKYEIVDDWTDAATYVDFSDPKLAKVFYNGKDVTAGFDINVSGTTTIATAKAPFLAATKGLAKAGEVKLVVSGFFRDDYDTNGQLITLTNSGSETWNTRTEKTNAPAVYAWTPNPNKQVLGSSEESGSKAHDDINGSSVWPGQKLEYRVGVDLRVPAGTARGVKTLAVEDVYDPYFLVDKHSVEFWDSRDPLGPKPVPRSAYKLTFDEAGHTFTATFSDEWIAKNVGADGANDRWLTQGWLTMRVTGTVSKSIPAGSTVVNQAFQIINGARTATEIPTVEIPTVKPDKDSLTTDMVDIDGKTLVQGDVVVYRLLLDGGPSRDKLAYNVHKMGIVDDFDEEFLTLEESDITVTNKATGEDVTGKFNVQIKDGVAYVFAKTVDTEGVYGGIIPGDPQPEDLSVFDAAAIRPLEDPIIDQTLLGQLYNVTLRATVSKEQDGHVIENQARQNIQNVQTTTRIVSNPLKDIDPKKDVVISEETKGTSIEGTEVRMNTVFNYHLDSSEIPADRAYTASQWSISDTFDRVHDQYTGIWAVYANTDVYDGETLLFKKGDLLQDSAGHESEPWSGFFDVTFDEDSYTLKVEATAKYLELIGKRPDLANAFSVYAKMIRVAPGEDIANKVIESYNRFERESNTVTTYTIEYPDIDVVKFTAAEGEEEGLHRSRETAHKVTEEELAEVELTEDGAAGPAGATVQNGVEVGIHFNNAGDVPLKEVTLTDLTHDGLYGQLQDLVCAVPADPTAPGAIQGDSIVTPDENGMVWVTPATITELPVADAVDCRGTLREMAPGMTHADTVVVTGKSIFTDTLVKAEDTWFAVAASTPSVEIVEYTLGEGREAGDRNDPADPLVLDAGQAKYGTKVAFDITNTGDEPLSGIAFKNATQGNTTGTVGNVKWLDQIKEDDPAPAEPAEDAAAAETAADDAEAPSEAEGEVPAEETEPEKPVAPVNIVEIDGERYAERALSEFTELGVGESVLLVGTLTDVKPGTNHTDVADIEAEGKYSGTPVKDSDPWNAKLPPAVRAGAVTGEGVQTNDRQSMLGAASMLLLAASVVAFMIRRRARSRVV